MGPLLSGGQNCGFRAEKSQNLNAEMTASLELFVAPKKRLKTEYPFLFQLYAAAVREKLLPGLVD